MSQLIPRDVISEAIGYLDGVVPVLVSDDTDAVSDGSLRLPQVVLELVASTRTDWVTDLFTVAIGAYAEDRIDAGRLCAEVFTRLLEWPEVNHYVRDVVVVGGVVPFPHPDFPHGNRHQASVQIDLRPTPDGLPPSP